MKIQGVVLDMDGTLIDSREIILGAFKHVFDEVDAQFDEKEVRTHVGRVLDDMYKDLAPDHDSRQLVELHRSWQADNHHLLKGFDGLEEFLKSLNNLGLKLALFTSATRSRADLALEGLNISSYFDAVVCGDEVDNPKPNPEGIEKIVSILGLPAEELIMVGDADHDIMSGNSAGSITIGITHGFGSKEALQKAGADYIVDDLKELLTLINKLKG